MTKMIENEWMHVPKYGFIADYRWNLATDIIHHCALVTAQIDGEDSAGRQAIKLMSPADVAARAMDIADNMVNMAHERGWFLPPTVTDHERAQYAGLLEKMKHYGGYSDDNTKLSETMEKIMLLTGSEVSTEKA